VSPAEEYAQRLAAREARVRHYEQIHIRLGNIRLLIALLIAFTAWLAIWRHVFALWWLLVPLGIFLAIGIYHSRVLDAKAYAERAVAVYRHGIARLEDRWAGIGSTGERFNDPHHVYAADLDLFGSASLFQLLSLARTRMGEDTLARWLLSPGAPDEIRERQAAIAELRDQLDLREDLAVLGGDATVGVHPQPLIEWAEAPNRLARQWMRIVSPLLALCALAAAVFWGLEGHPTPLLIVLIIEAILVRPVRLHREEILHGAEHQFEDLDLLSASLARLERETFQSPRLQALMQRLSSHYLPGSRAIARLRTIVDCIDSRDNVFVRVLDLPMLYSVQLAYAAEAWRRKHGTAVRRWLEVIGDIEALLSLAAYSYEHPADPFPEIASGPACFSAELLGHPLLPVAKCVRNDLTICGEARVLLVSGSNMSGKSTLLRAVGINTVLAMAGAPVRARSLRLSPLQVGASIRVNDSLQEGSSRFYAEITRLRHIFDLAQDHRPLLALMDELLQGTNSHDRKIGAEGIVRALLARGAIGLISTHDLALTDIMGNIHNVHFEDEFQHGRITFDYKLREGVVTKSNGLELMRSIGLEV
jgi:MutS-like protein